MRVPADRPSTDPDHAVQLDLTFAVSLSPGAGWTMCQRCWRPGNSAASAWTSGGFVPGSGPAGAHGAGHPRRAVALRFLTRGLGRCHSGAAYPGRGLSGGLGWVPADPADALKLADAGVPETLRREVDAFLLAVPRPTGSPITTPATSASNRQRRVGRSISLPRPTSSCWYSARHRGGRTGVQHRQPPGRSLSVAMILLNQCH